VQDKPINKHLNSARS